MTAEVDGDAPLQQELDRLRAENRTLRQRLAGRSAPEDVLIGADAWRQLVETLPQIVWITRPDGWHIHFNRQWTEFTGLTLEESLGHGWNPPFHPQDRDRAAAQWEEATRTGEPYEIEYRLRRRDGVYRWMLGRAMPLRDPDGTIVRWFGTCTDIDDLKHARSELDHNRALLRLAGSMARLGGWSIAVADQRVLWSEQVYEILGYPVDAQPDLDGSIARYLPEYRQQVRSALDACARTGESFDLEAELEAYDGRRLWVRIIGMAQYGTDGQVAEITGALQDVSASKEAEQRVKLLAERLTATLESITDGLYTLDRDGRFTYVNPRAQELLQQDADELLGRDVVDAFPGVSGTEVETAARRALETNQAVLLDEYHYPPLDTWFQVNFYPSKQGLTVSLRDISDQHRNQQALRERIKELQALTEINALAQRVTDPQELCDLTARMLVEAMRTPMETLVDVTLGDASSGRVVIPPDASTLVVPIRVDGAPGGEVTIADATGAPFLAEEESLVRTVAETLGLWEGRRRASDALHRVNQELNEANAQLAEAAERKDDLLSMASHELRTPLTPTLGFLEVLQQRGDNLTEEQRLAVRVIRNNTRRMLRLVDDLLVGSRAASDVLVARPEPVSVRSVLDDVLEELDDTVAEVRSSIGPDMVSVDPRHLGQILVNLLTNATKYGDPPIVVSTVDAGEGRVRLEVADHGPGVPADFQQRMWYRFEQRDRGDTRTSSGTGLGLAIIKLLAETNHGDVTYQDGDPGAIFRVGLPAPDPA